MEIQNINKAEVAPKTETQVQDIFINGKSTNEYTDRVEMFIKIIEWDSNCIRIYLISFNNFGYFKDRKNWKS